MAGRAARPLPLAVAALAVLVIGSSRPAADRQSSSGGQSGSDAPGNTAPVVTIVRPDASRTWQWGAQFRYAITVTDKEDGDSAFGEIVPSEVLLDVEYHPATHVNGREPVRPATGADEPALAILRKSACLNCHADKTSLVGPSFSAIANKHGDSEETIAHLGRNIRNGSSGSWGSLPMPPHPHLSAQQTQNVARFIVEQGRRPHRWIYAGLEGVIRIIDRPDGDDVGFYTLTATYMDNGVDGGEGTSRRGEHRITLRIDQLKQLHFVQREYLVVTLIHEILHTLGPGSDPPSSRGITERVLPRCGAATPHLQPVPRHPAHDPFGGPD